MSSETYQMEQPSKFYFKIKKKFNKDLLDMLMSSTKGGNTIVEIGPGQGGFALECKSRNIDYTGIEPSASLRSELTKMEINVIDALVPPIPVRNEFCDIVLASTMLEHLPSHIEATKFANELNRVLKKGKIACVIVPNYLTSKSFFFEMDYTHSYITTKIRVTNLLRDAGLKVIDVRHAMGWLWVKTGFFHNVLRHIINIIMVPIHWGFTTWLFEYLGVGSLLWKIRKTFFETLIITARKEIE